MIDKKVKMNNFNGRRVELRDGEDINRALRKFKNKVEDSGIMDELRKREFFEKPTTERKRRHGAAVNRYKKKLEKERLPTKLY
jgi:small subunit ribosomal protein S21